MIALKRVVNAMLAVAISSGVIYGLFSRDTNALAPRSAYREIEKHYLEISMPPNQTELGGMNRRGRDRPLKSARFEGVGSADFTMRHFLMEFERLGWKMHSRESKRLHDVFLFCKKNMDLMLVIYRIEKVSFSKYSISISWRKADCAPTTNK